jgi:hypothetical protein
MTILTMLLIAFGLVIIFACIFLVRLSSAWSEWFEQGTTPITDQGKYAELLTFLRAYGLANNFPNECGENTLAFFYLPRFLQGGTKMYLRICVTEDWLQNFILETPKQILNCDRHGKLFGKFPPSNLLVFQDLGFPSFCLLTFVPEYAKSNCFREFPSTSTYEILTHSGIAMSGYVNGGANWKYGKFEGIAIDRTNLEVFYYMEMW